MSSPIISIACGDYRRKNLSELKERKKRSYRKKSQQLRKHNQLNYYEHRQNILY